MIKRKTIFQYVLLSGFFLALPGCFDDSDKEGKTAVQQSVFADVIYQNGKIYTVDDNQPWAEAVAIKDGKFITVGSNDTVIANRGPETKMVDLSGKMVMPGLHDGHLHLLLAGLANTQWCRLPNKGWEAAKKQLQACAEQLPRDEWLFAFPYQAEWFENGVDKTILDEVVPDRPLYMPRWDIHITAVNSKGLEIALSQGTDELFAGGRLIYDEQGEPTGELIEGASWLAGRNLPKYTDEQVEKALLWSIKTANRFGVVSVQESSATEPLLKVLKKLDEQGKVSMYVAAYVVWWNENFGEASKEEMDALSANREQYHSPHVDVSFAKIWLDGTPVPPNPSTVKLDKNTNKPEYHNAFIDQQRLNQAVIDFDNMGVQIKMHATAAGAARMALDALAATRAENPDSNLMHQLGHSSEVSPQDYAKAAELRAGADFSPAVWHWTPQDDSFPMRSLNQAGVIGTLGSDWPFPNVDDNNPFPPLADALVRTRQGIDIETGIKMLTINGAMTIGNADQTGSIEAGKSADFVVLDRNLLESTPEEIRDTQVLETVFEGRTVYRAE